MQVQQFIYIGSLQIYTVLLFVLAGILVSLFILWLEGSKDGFDYERLFDLFFLVTFLSAVFSLAVIWYLSTKIYLTGMDYFFVASYLSFLTLLFAINYFTKKWSWSYFRIADLSALTLICILTFLFLSQVLIYKAYGWSVFLALSVFSLVLGILFRRKLPSGLIFSIFLLVYAVIAISKYSGLDNLIFYAVLITISLSTFFRRKKVGYGYAQFSIIQKFHRKTKKTII